MSGGTHGEGRGRPRSEGRPLGGAQRAGGKAPGLLGRLLSEQLGTSRRATDKSASLGREGRSKLGV